MRRTPPTDTRQIILDTACQQFATQGFSNTSLRSIAEAVGVTKAALYYHFAAKDQILVLLIEPLAREVDALLARADDKGMTSVDILTEYLQVLLEHRSVMKLVVRDPSVLSHPEIGRALVDRQRRLRNALASRPPLATGGQGDEQGDLRAACALAAIQSGVALVPTEPLEEASNTVLAAGLGALGVVLADV